MYAAKSLAVTCEGKTDKMKICEESSYGRRSRAAISSEDWEETALDLLSDSGDDLPTHHVLDIGKRINHCVYDILAEVTKRDDHGLGL